MKSALIIVDVQNDFVEGGALACSGGKALVPVINRIVAELKPDVVITTQDWHPAKTVHFDKWPVHCVRKSKGAELVAGLELPLGKTVQIRKGTSDADDGYSGFEGRVWSGDQLLDMDIVDVLDNDNIKHVYVCGIATDYCVKATALDAVKRGYQVTLIENAIVGVDTATIEQALTELRSQPITFATL